MKRIAVLLLMMISFSIFAQTTKTAKLKPTVERLTIHNYNVNIVVDDREDTSNIGTMRAGITNRTAFVNLPNGARAAISDFINENLWQSPSTDSIELHILELNIRESVKGLNEKTILNSKYGFFKNGKKIMDYSGNSYVQTGMDASAYIGKLVSQSIEQVLKEFDSWWSSNRQMFDESQKNQLKVNVRLQTSGTDADEIVYSATSPLVIADFKGIPDVLSKALAATFSGFSISYELQGDNSGSTANVMIKPYFETSKSWMKPGGKASYVLQHEQLHFDITAIKTYDLIIALKNHAFTVADFKEQISNLQKQYSKEMEQMQAEYDSETSHGIFKDKQNMWQVKIKKELQEKLIAAGK